MYGHIVFMSVGSIVLDSARSGLSEMFNRHGCNTIAILLKSVKSAIKNYQLHGFIIADPKWEATSREAPMARTIDIPVEIVGSSRTAYGSWY